MDKVVKVMLREEDIDTLDTRAKAKGKPRMYLLREIIEGYLSGTQVSPSQVPTEAQPGQVAALSKALEESQRERDVLQVRVVDLEKALTSKSNDLEYTRGQWQALNNNLTEIIQRIPPTRPLLEESGKKVSWWGRLTGQKSEDPTNDQ